MSAPIVGIVSCAHAASAPACLAFRRRGEPADEFRPFLYWPCENCKTGIAREREAAMERRRSLRPEDFCNQCGEPLSGTAQGRHARKTGLCGECWAKRPKPRNRPRIPAPEHPYRHTGRRFTEPRPDATAPPALEAAG